MCHLDLYCASWIQSRRFSRILRLLCIFICGYIYKDSHNLEYRIIRKRREVRVEDFSQLHAILHYCAIELLSLNN